MVLKNTVILIPVKKNFEHLKYKNALKEKKKPVLCYNNILSFIQKTIIFKEKTII